MIRYTPSSERKLSLFKTPFENELDPANRWVRMADLVPWDDMAQVFMDQLNDRHGRPSVDLRIILGALLVKHIQGLSDEDTIDYIQENIYAQYFVGLSSFQIEPVFVPSLFVEIRKRLGAKGADQLNSLLIKQAKDLWPVKPRTYRREARKRYIGFSKKRNKSKKAIRKAVGQQLRYVRRNIKTLHKMLDQLQAAQLEIAWDKHEWRMFWIIQELYRQQDLMYQDKRKRIDDRLVSLQQPHARPIKRGKSGDRDTEFGPKINVSLSEGMARVDQIDFNAFNESQGLIAQVEAKPFMAIIRPRYLPTKSTGPEQIVSI